MLKKCLLGLFVGFVGFIGFSSAAYELYPMYSFFIQNPTSTSINWDGVPSADRYCIVNNFGNFSYDFSCSNNWINLPLHNSYCVSKSEYSQGHNICFDGRYGEVGIVYYADSELTLPYTSLQCQTEYNLIPVEDVDENYCVQNDLCPVFTGNNWSELMINNIVHEGKPLINISIPDNIYWDYATDDNQFDLYVGSGYDQDYIDSVLAINSYRPDNEDFTNMFVSGLTLIFPYIFVALLIVFIWKLLKRIFK